MKSLLYFFLLLLCAVSFPEDAFAEKIARTAGGEMVLDGELDEARWAEAIRFGDFKQLTPHIGMPPGEKTEVLVHYDADYLYVGIKAYYRDPQAVFASVLERDQPLGSDDYLAVIIDSYNDRINALGFETNPLGTRGDFELRANGDEINRAWDTFWDVRTRRTPYGWNAEFRIPFASLRYTPGAETVMGFKFIRFIKTRSEKLIYPLNNENVTGAEYHLANTESITLHNLEKKNPLYLRPYLTGSLARNALLNPEGSAYRSETELFPGKSLVAADALDRLLSNSGFDLKYKLNNHNTLDLTANTDFAQAEADDRVINLTRFSVLLPEKRYFFLENANFFSSSMHDHRFFHSRTIGIENGLNVPLLGGVRLNGTAGSLQYGALNLQSRGIDSEGIEAKNFTVLRLTRNSGSSDSYLGGIVTQQLSTESGDYNRLAGIDGRFRLSENVLASFFAAGNRDHQLPSERNLALGTRINRFPANGFEYDYRYREYQENFQPAMAFIDRRNSRRLTIRNGYRRSFKNHPWLSGIILGNWNTRYWIAANGAPEYSQSNLYWHLLPRDGSVLTLYFPLVQEDRLYAPWQIAEHITIPSKRFFMNKLEFYYQSGKGKRHQWSFWTLLGGFYGGRQQSFTPEISYIVNQHFNFSLTFEYNRLQFPDEYASVGRAELIRTLYGGRLNYFFSSRLSVKTLLQFDNQSQTLGANIRLRYHPREGSDLYLVYNHNMNIARNDVTPERPLFASQAVIVKYTRTFAF
ncbi:MAG: carbohydrate binding family 9 domain-containing protein [Calditrichae bacterium]|nr:carbohydrate binding family 9 domain-containing protein [Calditrichia bacterium]